MIRCISVATETERPSGDGSSIALHSLRTLTAPWTGNSRLPTYDRSLCLIAEVFKVRWSILDA